ncbi:TadE/TadG family type IV pilus assembly protein [Roseibium litorale]|uniref:Pilus assembly protein n=1 Tax=Roseibium litorale TaxID=2803841 RepID=A0ABR9CPI4_9HYPH|nr:TadE/TadG family type IV pilus assembly protein [Roseibium litorale]MBD8892330.1 pilus assembly protein [Roseibium litorale]
MRTNRVSLFIRLQKNTRGVAAVEFALILPFLIILLIGMAEATTGLNQNRKVAQVASSIGDMVARATSVSSTSLADLMKARTYIMEPYDASNMTVIVASVSFDKDKKATVDWSADQSGGTPWAKDQAPPITIPDGAIAANKSIIVCQTKYTYVPMFASLAQNIFPRATSIDMSGVVFLRPRLTTKVTKT